MALKIQELLERLREVDECPEIEAKRAATELGRSALDTISAFANEPGMGGGYLLFGLEEDLATGHYEVTGIARSEEARARDRDSLRHRVQPRATAEGMG